MTSKRPFSQDALELADHMARAGERIGPELTLDLVRWLREERAIKAKVVSEEEGGPWLTPGTTSKVHSIAFSNGRIWDAANGWREER